MAALLIRNGAAIHFANEKDGASALWIAAFNGQEAVVQTLITNGADLDLPSNNGCRPIDSATQRKHTAVVNLLLRNGCIEI